MGIYVYIFIAQDLILLDLLDRAAKAEDRAMATPLDEARLGGHTDIVELLLDDEPAKEPARAT